VSKSKQTQPGLNVIQLIVAAGVLTVFFPDLVQPVILAESVSID
jgi:hypothetical protein